MILEQMEDVMIVGQDALSHVFLGINICMLMASKQVPYGDVIEEGGKVFLY